MFDVDGVRIAVVFDLDRELEMLPTGVDLIAYFQFNAFDMTDRETAAIAAVRSGAYRKIASKRSVWFACMAPIGAYDESVYTGGSFVLDDCGRVVARRRALRRACWIQEIQRGVMLDALEDHELPEFRSEEWLMAGAGCLPYTTMPAPARFACRGGARGRFAVVPVGGACRRCLGSA